MLQLTSTNRARSASISKISTLMSNARVLTTAAVIVFSMLYLVGWVRAEPVVDFPAFYSAGRLYREGQRVYDLQAQCEAQKGLTTLECFPFPHPPVLLPVIALTAVDNFGLAYRLYGVFIIFLFSLCLFPLNRLAERDSLKTTALITFLPTWMAVIATQSTPLALLGVLFWVMFLVKGRDFVAGIALSLSLVKPHIAVALAVPLLFARRRAFFGFCAGGAALVAYSFLLIGAEGFKDFVDIARLMSKGEGYYINQHRMFNVAGALSRSGLNTFWAWPAYVAGVAIVSLLWRKAGTGLPLLGVGVVVATLTAPHLHLHDLSLLIVPMLLLPAWSSVLITGGLSASLGTTFLYPYAYCLMATLVYVSARAATHVTPNSDESASLGAITRYVKV
jgi:hypothetical protein